MFPYKFLSVAIVTALIAGAGIWSAHADAPRAGNPLANSIAVVDIADAMNNLRITQRLRAEIEAERNRLSTEETNRTNQLRSLQDELQLMGQGTPAFHAKVAEIEAKTLDFQIWREYEVMKINQKVLVTNEQAYRQLLQAITEHARGNEIGLVLFKERPFTMSGEPSREELETRIQMRKVLYVAEEMDITRDIVQAVNRRD
ncbi:MAG: OmpH family outer membrane protein [Phycisphaeraceae bacterium]|nr:OmpH family outer membrane protein [Phycisphaeraceae bacterium]